MWGQELRGNTAKEVAPSVEEVVDEDEDEDEDEAGDKAAFCGEDFGVAEGNSKFSKAFQ